MEANPWPLIITTYQHSVSPLIDFFFCPYNASLSFNNCSDGTFSSKMFAMTWLENPAGITEKVWKPSNQCIWHIPSWNSPGEESLRGFKAAALRIFSRQVSCSFLIMQLECVAVTWNGKKKMWWKSSNKRKLAGELMKRHWEVLMFPSRKKKVIKSLIDETATDFLMFICLF